MKHHFKYPLNITNALQLFKTLFNPIGINYFSVFTITSLEDNIFSFHTYEKVWLKTKYTTEELHVQNISGFIAFQYTGENIRNSDNHKYICNNKFVISSYYICDGWNDCSTTYVSTDSGDEMCDFSAQIKPFWKEMYETTSCVWSPFYYKTRNKNCSSYMITRNNSLTGAMNTEEFSCIDGTFISSLVVDDLVPDCSSDESDEVKIQNLLVNYSIATCINPSEIPCRQGHSKCFNISDICIYRLDQFDHLTPCRTGSHIEECNSFQCDQRYKCPRYYCIPNAYICDGKWDCP